MKAIFTDEYGAPAVPQRPAPPTAFLQPFPIDGTLSLARVRDHSIIHERKSPKKRSGGGGIRRQIK